MIYVNVDMETKTLRVQRDYMRPLEYPYVAGATLQENMRHAAKRYLAENNLQYLELGELRLAEGVFSFDPVLTKGHTIIELALCEQGHIVLKPNQLYILHVHKGCKACENLLTQQ